MCCQRSRDDGKAHYAACRVLRVCGSGGGGKGLVLQLTDRAGRGATARGDGMPGRIIHFLIGAVAAGVGGFVVWMHRDSAAAIFPPADGEAPWLLILGLAAASAGVVFLVSAIAPRPKRAARLAAEAARRQEALAAADAYYAERSRAADRDWRSGDLPPPVQPQMAIEPAPEEAARPPALALQEPPASLKPVASSVPPEAPAHQPFPASATLAPIPKSVDPPPRPMVVAATTEAADSPTQEPEASGRFAPIREAIAEGRLDEADRMLSTERETAAGEALAELTGLAGDHAAAAGRQSNAKWLWRLALKRFGEADAMTSPAARAVAERLRLVDQ